MNTEQTDHLVMNMEGNTVLIEEQNAEIAAELPSTLEERVENQKNREQEKPLSKREERELKLAYARALQQRKEVIKRNKELIADKELEVAYWKAEADLLRYRFEKMDFFLKNLEIESKYLMAKEKMEAELEAKNSLVDQPKFD